MLPRLQSRVALHLACCRPRACCSTTSLPLQRAMSSGHLATHQRWRDALRTPRFTALTKAFVSLSSLGELQFEETVKKALRTRHYSIAQTSQQIHQQASYSFTSHYSLICALYSCATLAMYPTRSTCITLHLTRLALPSSHSLISYSHYHFTLRSHHRICNLYRMYTRSRYLPPPRSRIIPLSHHFQLHDA